MCALQQLSQEQSFIPSPFPSLPVLLFVSQSFSFLSSLWWHSPVCLFLFPSFLLSSLSLCSRVAIAWQTARMLGSSFYRSRRLERFMLIPLHRSSERTKKKKKSKSQTHMCVEETGSFLLLVTEYWLTRSTRCYCCRRMIAGVSVETFTWPSHSCMIKCRDCAETAPSARVS